MLLEAPRMVWHPLLPPPPSNRGGPSRTLIPRSYSSSWTLRLTKRGRGIAVGGGGAGREWTPPPSCTQKKKRRKEEAEKEWEEKRGGFFSKI
jgi:hypothetical protein